MEKIKQGFTLAEVLITLGIIGVVAALTIPSLIQSYKKQVVSARLKKFYSTMEQAIKLSEIDNGPVESWKKEPCKYSESDIESYLKDRKAVITFYETYIKPYLRVTNEDFEYIGGRAGSILIYLSDSSTFYMFNGACIDFHYDINGMKSPNSYGADRFAFLICPTSYESTVYGFSANQNFRPLVYRISSASRENLFESCKSTPTTCSGLLMYDNWEFKDDYPYKL